MLNVKMIQISTVTSSKISLMFKYNDLVIYTPKNSMTIPQRGVIEQVPDFSIGLPHYVVFIKGMGRVNAFEDELNLESQNVPNLQTACGQELDKVGKQFGIERYYANQFWPAETDENYRARIFNLASIEEQLPTGLTRVDSFAKEEEDPHNGHEIVENQAGGKSFKYCRVCKTEVF